MVYKLKKDTVRKYYKVSTTTQTWTQPSMSANGSLGGDIFAVSSTNNSDNAYHAFDGDGVRINLGTLTLYNPNPFCITKLVFAGKRAGAAIAFPFYVNAFTLYGSNNNSSWMEIQSFSGGSLSSKTYDVTNSAYYKYYKITVTDATTYEGNPIAYICNLTITATEQVTVYTESTSSDYDIYKDITTNNLLTEKEYYKYQAWTQPVLSANGTMGGSSFACNQSSYLNVSSLAYKAFDGNASTSASGAGWHSASGHPSYIEWYNPNPLKITKINVKNRGSDGSFVQNYTLFYSDNGSTYNEVMSGTSPSQTANAYWDINLTEENAHKYWRLTCTSSSGSNSDYTAIDLLTITATQVVSATASDYDFYKNKYKALVQ